MAVDRDVKVNRSVPQKAVVRDYRNALASREPDAFAQSFRIFWNDDDSLYAALYQVFDLLVLDFDAVAGILDDHVGAQILGGVKENVAVAPPALDRQRVDGKADCDF